MIDKEVDLSSETLLVAKQMTKLNSKDRHICHECWQDMQINIADELESCDIDNKMKEKNNKLGVGGFEEKYYFRKNQTQQYEK